jgi:hypothetical protein
VELEQAESEVVDADTSDERGRLHGQGRDPARWRARMDNQIRYLAVPPTPDRFPFVEGAAQRARNAGF